MGDREKKPDIKVSVCVEGKKHRCGGCGAHEFAEALRDEVAHRKDLKRHVKVKETECLGVCKKGINVRLKDRRPDEEGDKRKATYISGLRLEEAREFADEIARRLEVETEVEA